MQHFTVPDLNKTSASPEHDPIKKLFDLIDNPQEFEAAYTNIPFLDKHVLKTEKGKSLLEKAFTKKFSKEFYLRMLAPFDLTALRTKNTEDDLPIHIAIRNKNKYAFDAILEYFKQKKGSLIFLTYRGGKESRTCFHLAAQNNLVALAKIIAYEYAKIDEIPDGENLLTEGLKIAISTINISNVKQDKKQFLFHQLAEGSCIEMVTLLLAHKLFDVTQPDNRGYTSLHAAMAACLVKVEMLDLLFVESDIKTKDFLGNTLLHTAASNGYVEGIQWLFAKFTPQELTVFLSATNSNFDTPWLAAMRKKKYDAAQILSDASGESKSTLDLVSEYVEGHPEDLEMRAIQLELFLSQQSQSKSIEKTEDKICEIGLDSDEKKVSPWNSDTDTDSETDTNTDNYPSLPDDSEKKKQMSFSFICSSKESEEKQSYSAAFFPSNPPPSAKIGFLIQGLTVSDPQPSGVATNSKPTKSSDFTNSSYEKMSIHNLVQSDSQSSSNTPISDTINPNSTTSLGKKT